MAQPDQAIGPRGLKVFQRAASTLHARFGVGRAGWLGPVRGGFRSLLIWAPDGCSSRILAADTADLDPMGCPVSASLRDREPSSGECGDPGACGLGMGQGNQCFAASIDADSVLVFRLMDSGSGVGAGVEAVALSFAEVLADALELDAEVAPSVPVPFTSFARAFTHHPGFRREYLQKALDIVGRVLGADLGVISLMDGDGSAFRLLAEMGLPKPMVGMTVPIEGSISGYVCRLGRLVHLQKDEIIARGFPPLVGGIPVVEAVCLPLRIGDRILGAINMGISEGRPKRAFTDEDVENARILGHLVSELMDGHRLAGDWRNQTLVQARMLEAGSAAPGHRLDRSFAVVLEHMSAVTGAEFALHLRHPGGDPSLLEIAATQPPLPGWIGLKMTTDGLLPGGRITPGLAVVYKREELETWNHPGVKMRLPDLGGMPEEVMLVGVTIRGTPVGLLALIHKQGSTGRFTWSQAAALGVLVRDFELVLDNARILDLLDDKQRQLSLLLREAHHRIKNSLQQVVSLLAMDENRLLRDDAADALRVLRLRVGNMARIHEMMSGTPTGCVDLEELLRSAAGCTVAPGAPGGPEIVWDIGAQRRVDPERAMPLAMAVHELVLNAVKHAKPRGLRISARNGDGRVVIEVENDGAGDVASSRDGMGLELVRTMVRHQLHGSLHWEKADGRVVARIEMPERRRTPVPRNTSKEPS